MGKTKSDNRFLGLLTGHYAQKLHTSALSATIPHKTGEPMVILRVCVNTSTASVITLTDLGTGTHGQEVIASMKASIVEGVYPYGVPCYGDLKIDNPGGSDLTIVYSNR